MRICSVEGCEKRHKAYGFCQAHYLQDKKENQTRICGVKGCYKKVHQRDWCTTHYWRWWRTGNPLTILKPRHGLSKTTESIIWTDIKMRCYNENDPNYHNYGGRGIKMYDPWRDSFLQFRKYLEDTIGLRPSKDYTLDRVNNSLGYKPGNLRWATILEQQNNKRNNILLTLGNRTQTLMDWSTELNLNPGTVKSRIRAGWAITEVLSPQGRPTESITINGVTKTIRQWANISKIRPSTIRRRYRAGWEDSRVLSPVVPQDRLVTINGETKRLHEWCNISGLSRGTIMRRINLGWAHGRLLAAPSSYGDKS